MAVFTFTKSTLKGKLISVFNHGNHTQDFTYVNDIVEGVIRSTDQIAQPDPAWERNHPDPAASNAPFSIFNIGNNGPIKLSAYIDAIEAALRKKAVKVRLPLQAGDVPDTFADSSELHKATGYRSGTPFTEVTAAFVQWYRQYFKL